MHKYGKVIVIFGNKTMYSWFIVQYCSYPINEIMNPKKSIKCYRIAARLRKWLGTSGNGKKTNQEH